MYNRATWSGWALQPRYLYLNPDSSFYEFFDHEQVYLTFLYFSSLLHEMVVRSIKLFNTCIVLRRVPKRVD